MLNQGTNIFVMNSDGSGQTQLTTMTPTSPEYRCPDWSMDGKRIFFDGISGAGWDIWVMNADGSGQKKLTSFAASASLWPHCMRCGRFDVP